MSRPIGSKNKPKDNNEHSSSLYRGQSRTEVLANLAQNLTDTRDRCKLSVLELANISGIKEPTLYAYINGKSAPNSRNRWLLADALGCSIDWLLADHSHLEEDEAFKLEGAPNITFLDLAALKVAADKIKVRTNNNFKALVFRSKDDDITMHAILNEINQYIEGSSGNPTVESDTKAEREVRRRMAEANVIISKVDRDASPLSKEGTKDKRANLSARMKTLLGAIGKKTTYLERASLSYTGAANIVNGNVWPNLTTFQKLVPLFPPVTLAQLMGDAPLDMETMNRLSRGSE